MTHCPPRHKNVEGVITATAPPSSAIDGRSRCDHDGGNYNFRRPATTVAATAAVPKPVSEILIIARARCALLSSHTNVYQRERGRPETSDIKDCGIRLVTKHSLASSTHSYLCEDCRLRLGLAMILFNSAQHGLMLLHSRRPSL